MRNTLIAGNWKMNTNVIDAVRLVHTMRDELAKEKDVEIVLCPPFVSFTEIKKLLDNTPISLGAQNMYYQEKGAFTGEIAPLMLAGLCKYVILGHSERRQYFYETDELVNFKIKAAVCAGINPILCVGENLNDKDAGQTHDVIYNQVKNGLSGVNPFNSFVIAYEPVWAIGTGKAATASQANSTIAFIRTVISDIWSTESADNIRILYGGSVTGSNISEFIAEPEIDGALVGGASLKADEFVAIVRKSAISSKNR